MGRALVSAVSSASRAKNDLPMARRRWWNEKGEISTSVYATPQQRHSTAAAAAGPPSNDSVGTYIGYRAALSRGIAYPFNFYPLPIVLMRSVSARPLLIDGCRCRGGHYVMTLRFNRGERVSVYLMTPISPWM